MTFFFRGRFVPAAMAGVLLALALMGAQCQGNNNPPENQAPTASAGANQTVEQGVLVTLNGSASSDPDGDALTYEWTQTGGTAVTLAGGNTVTATFTAPSVAGALTFQLTVSDGELQDSSSVTITVLEDGEQPPVNQAPDANAGPNQTVDHGALVTLNGSASSDPDGDALTYQWIQTGGSLVTLNGQGTATPTFTAPLANTVLTFQLTVSDGQLQDSASVTITVQGQEPPPPDNRAPTADAGADKTVAHGASVTLDGTGSSDPDAGTTLTYQWLQIEGIGVTLTGANTATATFTAPNGDDTLRFQLTVSDGQLQDTDFITITVGAGGPAITPRLYVTNYNTNSVVHYANPADIAFNGDVTPSGTLVGGQTLLDRPADALVTITNALIVTNVGSSRLTRYDNASSTNGDLAPGAFVDPDDLLLNPVSLAVNAGQDLVFVCNIIDGAPKDIAVYDTATLTPVRSITSDAFRLPSGINFGPNDDLYVANSGNNRVLVYANASANTFTGELAPTRTITSPGKFTDVFDVFVDGTGILYVVNQSGTVNIFNTPAGLTGDATPDATLTVPGAELLTAIVVDENGIGYIVDNEANAVYIYNNVSTRNGSVAPDRTIKGPNTQLTNPIRAFLVE